MSFILSSAGQYYLCDSGYTHGPGFVTPYPNTRYHLKSWGVGREAPQNHEEYFNMLHSKARNVIERAFGVLKIRWAIINEQSKYPVEVQNKVILACCLSQNFIRLNMSRDSLEDVEFTDDEDETENDDPPDESIQVLRRTDEWTAMRDNLAMELYNEWLESRGGV